MQRKWLRFTTLLVLMLVLLPARSPGLALAGQQATDDRAILDFPNSVTFQADLTSPDSRITSVTLEYGVDVQTCGTVVAKAFPDFTPGGSVSVEWTWDMRQSGSLPPGAVLWWRWRTVDENQAERVTETRQVIWLDSQHDWQTIRGGGVNLHWYSGSSDFARGLHDTATSSLDSIQSTFGLTTDRPVELYIYASTNDMRDVILYEPEWSGAMAFPDYGVVIDPITPGQSDWSVRSLVHEMTHIITGRYTFSCLGALPTWLNEGMSMVSEGALEDYLQMALDTGIRNDTIFPIRSLAGGFPETPDRAYLAYGQSGSMVAYLMQTYGKQRLVDLLSALRDGQPLEAALGGVYGLTLDGLENDWRASVGARPGQAVNATPTALPTAVPTYVPVSGAPPAATPAIQAPTAAPTPMGAASPVPGQTFNSVGWFTASVIFLVFCAGGTAIAVAAGIYVLTRRQRSSQ